MEIPLSANLTALRLSIPDVLLLQPVKHSDGRGFFSQTYSRRDVVEIGIDVDFIQDNHSMSQSKGVVRGLHFQIPPAAQHKLVRVSRGAIFDVAVDLRRGSANFGKSVSAILSAENWKQLFVPKGFAHGFCVLEPGTEVIYKVSDYYTPECERGLLWNDSAAGILWPIAPDEAILSERDRKWPTLTEIPPYFD